MTGYLLRRLATFIGGGCPCLAYRCGRPKIHTPSQWCRRHTDAILYQPADEAHEYPWRREVAGRLAGLNLHVLNAEIDAGRALALVRYVARHA